MLPNTKNKLNPDLEYICNYYFREFKITYLKISSLKMVTGYMLNPEGIYRTLGPRINSKGYIPGLLPNLIRVFTYEAKENIS